MAAPCTRNLPHTVVVLGGYGSFGSRVCRMLASRIHGLATDDSNSHVPLRLVVAGRRLGEARKLARELSDPGYRMDRTWQRGLREGSPEWSTPSVALPSGQHLTATVSAAQVDVSDLSKLPDALRALQADQTSGMTVINTVGPFQGQDYGVVEACLSSGSHYVDLADSREFVAEAHGNTALQAAAKRAGKVAIIGASTVPCLSSAVIDRAISKGFSPEELDYSVSPGNQTVRGLATIQAILSYVGHPFQSFENGKATTVYGWGDLRMPSYPGLGCRLTSPCNVPDLDLFPRVYRSLKTVKFRAGLEVRVLHLGTYAMHLLTRAGFVGNWARYAPLLRTMSLWFWGLGTPDGAMQVAIKGTDNDKDEERRMCWSLVACSGHGPYIPCTAAVILARKLASGWRPGTDGLDGEQEHRHGEPPVALGSGVFPAVSLCKLEEFEDELGPFDMDVYEEWEDASAMDARRAHGWTNPLMWCLGIQAASLLSPTLLHTLTGKPSEIVVQLNGPSLLHSGKPLANPAQLRLSLQSSCASSSRWAVLLNDHARSRACNVLVQHAGESGMRGWLASLVPGLGPTPRLSVRVAHGQLLIRRSLLTVGCQVHAARPRASLRVDQCVDGVQVTVRKCWFAGLPVPHSWVVGASDVPPTMTITSTAHGAALSPDLAGLDVDVRIDSPILRSLFSSTFL